MTFLLDIPEYNKMRADIPTQEDMIYVIDNVVYWYPEIKHRLNDAEQGIFQSVYERALIIIKNHEQQL